MKSVLPLIIAFVLVAMLSVATLYYITSVVTYNTDINMNRTYRSEWRILEEEVQSILLTILRKNSYYALQEFKNTFINNYQDSGFYEDPSRRIYRIFIKMNDYGYYYKYSRYSSTVYYCSTRDPNDLYKLNLKGYNMSRNDYLDALNKASADASNTLSNYAYLTINRWIQLRERLGYRIYLVNMTAYFNVKLESNPMNGSIGTTREGINVVLDIYSPWSGYRRINETVEVFFQASFKEAVEGDKQIYLPIKTLAYLRIGDIKTSYILDPNNVSVVLYSRMFHRFRELEYISGNLEKIILNRVGGYYLGKGETIMYFGMRARRNLVAFVYNTLYYMSLSDPYYDIIFLSRLVPPIIIFYDDYFRVPCSEDDSPLIIFFYNLPPIHTMTFFIGGLIYANIDGIHIATPIQIIYSYLYDTTQPSPGWSYYSRMVGDINQINWSP